MKKRVSLLNIRDCITHLRLEYFWELSKYIGGGLFPQTLFLRRIIPNNLSRDCTKNCRLAILWFNIKLSLEGSLIPRFIFGDERYYFRINFICVQNFVKISTTVFFQNRNRAGGGINPYCSAMLNTILYICFNISRDFSTNFRLNIFWLPFAILEYSLYVYTLLLKSNLTAFTFV